MVTRSFSPLTRAPGSSQLGIVLLGATLTILVLGGFAWGLRSVQQRNDHEEALDRLQSNLTRLAAVDEAMTRSVRMVAATGSSRWEEEYRSLVPVSVETSRRIRALGRVVDGEEGAARIEEANERLVEMEREALGLIRLGRRDDGLRLLSSHAYEAGKQTLVRERAELSAAAEAEAEAQNRYIRRRLLGGWFLIVSGAGALLLTWALVLALLRRNLSERDRVTRELDAQRGFLRAVVDASPNLIFVQDREGRFTLANEAMAAFYGMKPEEMVGKTDADLEISATDVEQFQRTSRQVMEAGETMLIPAAALRLPGRDRVHWTETRKVPLRAPDGSSQVLGIVTDVTDWKESQEALRQARDELQTLIDASPVAITALDLEGVVTLWNPAAERVLGWPAAEVLGRENVIVPSEKQQEFRANLERVARGETIRGLEIRRRRRDGTPVDLRLSAEPLRDARGEVCGALALLEDVTGSRRMVEQLRQADKLEAVGQLSGGIAHHFNNILQVIVCNTAPLLDELPDGDPIRADVEEIQSSADRAAALTRQLLTFSRQQEFQPQLVDLAKSVADSGPMLRQLLGPEIELVTALDGDCGRVKVDPRQLEQVLVNLAGNARDAMREGGRFSLAVRDLERDADAPAEVVDGGDWVVLSAADSGTGIDEETLPRIFDPFFTTKDWEEGPGLGLSTVYGIVQQSGGHIDVESEIGMGSTFRIYLPRAGAAAAAGAPGVAPRGEPGTGRGTILLAEDEAAVRREVRRLLERSGYAVLEAANGEDALHLAGQYDGTIDLLLTDVIMPMMGGRELAERISYLRPDVPVLYISGYTQGKIDGDLENRADFIQKPFRPQELVERVREVLEGAASHHSPDPIT